MSVTSTGTSSRTGYRLALAVTGIERKRVAGMVAVVVGLHLAGWLTNREQRALSVGFWFSLGHSSVVFGLTLLLSVGVRSLAGGLTDQHSALHMVTGWLGTVVSGAFLYVIALVNLVALGGLGRCCSRPGCACSTRWTAG